MFKGIKKRFSSNRSGRNRRLVNGGREQETAPREPPDKGGSKPTSPRQVHPVDQISPVPYARRSLERRSRTIPVSKTAPSGNPGGYDRRTESFCLSPTKEQQHHHMSTLAYPTTPNICVTGGKIEFITPPGSTLSSNASGNCSTLLSSPSLSSTPSPKGDSPQRARSTLPVNKTQKNSPSRRNSSRRRKSPKLSNPSATCISSERIKSPLISSPPPSVYPDDDKRASEKPVKEEGDELQILRDENHQIKKELSVLQEEFSKLQEYVAELEDHAGNITRQSSEENKNEPTQFQVALSLLEKILMKGEIKRVDNSKYRIKNVNENKKPILLDRCNTLEQVNAQLQADSVIQRQQYEKCLDKVASKVVQAILVQKNQQEQCERLTKRVEDLKQQNMTLSSFIDSKGKYQSLNYRRKAHLLPASVSSSNANSQSLPNTLIKAKENCDMSNVTCNENSACWYNNNHNNNNKEQPTSRSSPPFNTSRTHSDVVNPVLPPFGSSSLPQSASSKKRTLHHQSSADGCWYDIIKSLQAGETSHLDSITDNNNTSSDSSSVDTEERNLDSQSRTLPCIEDTISTSSSGDDFHAMSFPSTSRSQQQHPSISASNSSPFNPSVDCSLVSSSQYSNSKTLSAVRGRNQDITLDFNPPYHNTIVANFSVTENPKLGNKGLTAFSSNNKTNALGSCSNKARVNSPDDEQTKLINDNETKTSEGIVKDEGYSTMSSDVQSETKDNVAVVTISTVVEERGKSFDGESETKEESPTGTLKTNSGLIEALNVEQSNNKKNLSLGVVAVSLRDCDTSSQPEYNDDLRTVYDDDDTNSDILYIPIAEQCDKYMRHSFNFPFSDEPLELQRCSSDSYLYKLFVRFPNGNKFTSKKLSTNNNALQSLPLKKQSNNIYNSYLRRAFRRESMKRDCMKLFHRPLIQINCNEGKKNSSGSINYDFLSQIFPSSISHPRILSPSYSHAEMEDWSLDLSGEDITTPGGTEPSAAESSAPSHHHSQPSIQEATLDLEEDHHDFLWNGATYFKADDNDLAWPYDKSQTKSWDLNLVGNKECRSMISPKSGCSDQPAMWSSSEQLSCCSDIASKCSTDIENFCEQLCNLPELKRISVCSSENGGNESLPSNTKLSEIDSNDDTSELLDDDVNVETVFTRDFYRLVKFESTKSLTASSKSLATSEGFLTLEKLKGFESLHNNKTLASVLGFIAEQQKYCKDREVMDENAAFGPIISKAENGDNAEASFHLRVSGDSHLNNEMENTPEKRNVQDNILTTSESCAELNTEFRNSFSGNRLAVNPPPKPKRSTSLNLGIRGGPSYRSRGTLPPLPSTYSPPPIPSRSTSRSTLPHHSVFSKTFHRDPVLEIPEEQFPPPPLLDDPYVEPYHAIPMAPPPPKIPPHRIPIPTVPRRSSSISSNPHCDSPPVPKRITSRALPVPPPVSIPPRSTSLEVGTVPCVGEQRARNKFSRPKSLLKEASNTTSKIHDRQKRGSCGDLAPICRNSATLMLELQKMAKAEEEEKGSSGFYSPEATSPGTEVGLGTGWVRIEPVTDLGDPQTRANLLDNMLQSSEGCSSETDEDLAKHLQHTELLKAVQRNRRKRKASRHNSSDPLKVVGWGHNCQRPTILGRHSLFNRFGEEEEDALKEFHFLESFPSQSDVGASDQMPSSPYHISEAREDHYYSPRHSAVGFSSNSYLRPATDLKLLRSSEPCPDIPNYPVSSISQVDVDLGLNTSSPHLPIRNCTNGVYVSLNEASFGSPCTKTPTREQDTNSEKRKQTNLFPSFERLTNVHSSSSVDATDNKTPYRNVPSSPRPPHKICSSELSQKKSNILVPDARQSRLDEKILEPKQKLSKSKIPMKNEIDRLSRSDGLVAYTPLKESSEESELVDTRSLSNVKETIQKLNSRNSTSCSKLKGNSGNFLRSNLNSDLHSVSSPNSKPFSPSTKSCPPEMSARTAGDSNCSVSNKIEPSDTKNCSNSKRTPKLPGSNLIKRLTANSPQSKEVSAALPPKGSSPFRTKERPNVPSKTTTTTATPRPGGGILGKGLRSPRLPRFKMGGSRSDPLASFNGKSMCDSGSSEGSDKGCGGRISISDSCAEIFSPGESGDEVFSKLS